MLNDVKLLLGIPHDDNDQDDKLQLLISTARARLKTLLGGMEPPEDLDHIVMEVTVVRFNRIGSEGMASHTVEGESLTFADNDFEPFADEIEAFLSTQSTNSVGRVRFL